jgi:copper resistance protein D
LISAPDIASVVLRAIGFVLLFQAAGAALFVALFVPRLHDSPARIARIGTLAAAAAIVVLCAHYSLEAARMSGDFGGVLDASLQGLVLRSSTSEALALRLAGMGLVVLSLRMPARGRAIGTRSPGVPAARGRAVGVIGALLAAIAFTLTGHTSVNAERAILAPALLAHILIGMFWFGSLVPLWLVSTRETQATAANVIEAFSRTAVWVVPLLLVAGLLMTAILVPGWSTFGQPYGELLIIKLILFAGLMVLAAANKRRFGPGIAQGLPAAARRFRAAVAAEAVLIAVVLAVTACLTAFFSPE